MKYVCSNESCPNFGVTEELHKESYKFVSGQGLVGEHCDCPICGKPREEINPNAEVPLSEKQVTMNFFNGMSKEQKRELLRKRSHDHYESKIKERKDGLIQQAIGEMNNLKK